MRIGRLVRRPYWLLHGIALLIAGAGACADGQSVFPYQEHIWEVFPASEFYPYYLADPIRPQGAVMVLSVADSDIPESGKARFGLRLGGRFPLLRVHPNGNSECGWQLDFEGGFTGHFDMDYSMDNIGWDGLYGLLLSYKPTPNFGLRLGTQHDSAHLGDEYAERTGRERIGYTREEGVAGASWKTSSRWHFYLEGGYSYAVKPFQERWRAQAGLEYLGAKRWHHDRAGWYAALDLRAYAENDWKPRATTQIGLVIPTGAGTNKHRFALEIALGRSVLGEFFTGDESYAALGWYFDH